MTRRTKRRIVFAAALAVVQASHWCFAGGLYLGLKPRSVTGNGYINGNGVFGVIPGDRIDMDIVVGVYGDNGNLSDEGLLKASGSLVSTYPWSGQTSLTGTFRAQLDPAFRGVGSSDGASTDLDGDGDLDVGSNNNSSPAGYFTATALDGNMQPGDLFKLGTANFTVDAVTSATGTALLQFTERFAPDASIWMQDGQTITGAGYGGADGIWVYGVPEPAAATLGAVAGFASALRPRRREPSSMAQ